MTWRVLVHLKPSHTDHRGEAVKKEWTMAGLKGARQVRVGQAYELAGDLDKAQAETLAGRLLSDPVTQEATVYPADHVAAPKGGKLAEIWPKKGVSDPVADTVALAAKDLGISLSSVRSGHVYEFFGPVQARDVKTFCEGHLMNALIQSVEVL
jgi:phosphoribosylformylglycinamidine (FGAM) synthase PurS component